MYATEIFARYSSEFRQRSLSDEVVHHAKRAVIDWYAALFPGAVVAPPATLAGNKALAEDLDRGNARLALGRKGASTRAAALINGTAAHAAEVDDSFREASTIRAQPPWRQPWQPPRTRAPPAVSSCRLLGYEISTRIGAAMGRAHYKFWHNTGTVGTFGAAASAGARKSTGSSFAHALATAATFAAGLQQPFAWTRCPSPSMPGHAARGRRACRPRAPRRRRDRLAGRYRGRSTASGSSDERRPGLGQGRLQRSAARHRRHDDDVQEPRLLRAYVCRHRRRAGGAAARGSSAKPADITNKIKIGSYRAAKESPSYERPEDARRGALQPQVRGRERHWCTAACALRLSSRHCLDDKVTRELMKKIEVTIDPELDASFPPTSARHGCQNRDNRWPQGAIFLQPARKGDPELPLSDADLEAKYLELAGPVIGSEKARALLAQIWSLDTSESLP